MGFDESILYENDVKRHLGIKNIQGRLEVMCNGKLTIVSPAIGTARPYEYIGAPFVKTAASENLPVAYGAMMRPCSFTPSCGRYAGEKCFGYQIMLEPGVEYHRKSDLLQLHGHLQNAPARGGGPEACHQQRQRYPDAPADHGRVGQAALKVVPPTSSPM